MSTQEQDCLFCTLKNSEKNIIHGESYSILDGYPVTPGHTLVVPMAHKQDFFDLTDDELFNINSVIRMIRDMLTAGDPSIRGFNIGWNCGEVAGQTVMHAHCHIIPRRYGDMENPRGGVRGVIPEMQKYRLF